jgi:hypothetical protein
MTLSVKILTFMGYLVDEVVPKQCTLHNMGNSGVKMRWLELPVWTAPEDPLAHPYLRGTSVSRHTFTEELARNAAVGMDMSRKQGILGQDPDVSVARSARGGLCVTPADVQSCRISISELGCL